MQRVRPETSLNVEDIAMAFRKDLKQDSKKIIASPKFWLFFSGSSRYEFFEIERLEVDEVFECVVFKSLYSKVAH